MASTRRDLQIILSVARMEPSGSKRDCKKASLSTIPASDEHMEGRHRCLSHSADAGKHLPSMP